MKKKIVFAMLLVIGMQAKAVVSTCFSKYQPGIPVIKIVTENNVPVEAREILRSTLTGSLEEGAPLSVLNTDPQGVFTYDLGYYYTLDYSLVVDTRVSPMRVEFVSDDRDDGKIEFEILSCE